MQRRGNWWEEYYCSRIAYEYFTSIAEHPTGKKTGTLEIPRIAAQDRKFCQGFICGLFSVEGSVKAGRYPRLSIEMLEPKLIKQVSKALESFGIQTHTYDYPKAGKRMYGAYVYGANNLDKFLRRIGLVGRKRDKLTRLLSQPPVAS